MAASQRERKMALYSWPYYAMIILGLVLSGFSAFWKKTEESSVFSIGRLTLLGIFLFLSLWECNSRYLVCFLPVMILVSADGLMEGWKLLEKRLGKRQNGKAAQVSAGE